MLSTPPRIIRVEGFELSAKLSETVGNSRQMFDRRGALLFRVTSDNGLSGWGESWAYPGAASALAQDHFASVLLGRDATTPRASWHAMAGRLGYDRRGISTMALGGLDVALWDLAGLIADRPVHALLGGALRGRVTAYVSGPFMKPGADPYRDFDADIDGYLTAGFRAIKVRMGTDPAKDGATAKRIRARIGDAMPFMVDLNEGFSVEGARAIAARLAEHDLVWLEEPISHDDLPGYRRLAAGFPTALAGGEALFGLRAFRDYLAAGVFDFIQPDLGLCGGLSEAMRIAALCDAFEVAVVPHVWGSIVNFQASLHFAACLPERRGRLRWPLFEYDPSENPLRTAFGEHPLDGDGAVAVPDAPGLGLDLTPERLSPYVTRHWVID
ncbi:mandelate racemase/muconate lactonizing enzyme family protein [Bosea thiooxidans]